MHRGSEVVQYLLAWVGLRGGCNLGINSVMAKWSGVEWSGVQRGCGGDILYYQRPTTWEEVYLFAYLLYNLATYVQRACEVA